MNQEQLEEHKHTWTNPQHNYPFTYCITCGQLQPPSNPMKKEQSAAILTVKDISKMTPSGRRAIIKWLRQQISNIQKYHKKPGFASRYTARYIYPTK